MKTKHNIEFSGLSPLLQATKQHLNNSLNGKINDIVF